MLSDSNIWFSDGTRMIEIAVGGVLLFALTILIIRLLGKRSTSQMNNFDWIISVATGSLLASGILLRDISYAEAALAMIVLAGCQYLMTKLFVMFPALGAKLKAQPRLLTHKGKFLEDAMRAERITKDEIVAKLREAGMFSCKDANWVVIEADGRLSVVPSDDIELANVDTMKGVRFDKAILREVSDA